MGTDLPPRPLARHRRCRIRHPRIRRLVQPPAPPRRDPPRPTPVHNPRRPRSGLLPSQRHSRPGRDSINQASTEPGVIHLPDLETSDDQRAAAVAEALRGRSWDLDTAGAIAGGGGPISEDAELLDRILHLQLPSADDVDQVANELSEAATRLAALEETEAGRSRRSIDLLEVALVKHADHGDQPCPVCGAGMLDTDWRRRAEAQVEELRRTAAAYDEAARLLDEIRRRAQSLIAPVPFELSVS